MPEETKEYLQKMNEDRASLPGINQGFDFLFWQYQRLSVRLELEPMLARILSLAVLMTFQLLHANAKAGFAILAMISLVISVYWLLTVRILERRQEKLEGLLLQDGAGLARQKMIEWRHDDWKHPQASLFLRLEPGAWMFMALISWFVRSYLDSAG